LLWQVAHWLVSAMLACSLAGVQAAKPALWQVSQLAIATPVRRSYGVCVTGRASAGGFAPLWQVLHCPAAATCVWLKLVGFQPVTVWQLRQLAVVGMCVAGLPLALTPWQLAQLVAAVKPL
jgi:hypothetical protein